MMNFDSVITQARLREVQLRRELATVDTAIERTV